MRYGAFIVYASLLHAGWATCLLLAQAPLDIVATTSFRVLVPDIHLRMTLLFVVAGMAFHGRRVSSVPGVMALCIPQQLLLTLSAIDALTCVVNGAYADGYKAPSLFVLADQLPHLLGTVLHAAALVEHFGAAVRRRNQ